MSQQRLNHELMKLGELLLEDGLITKEQLTLALSIKKEDNRKKIGEILIEMGFVSELDIAKVLSIQLGIPLIDFSSVVVEPEAVQLVTEKLCLQHSFMPISVDKKVVKAVFADPLDLKAIDDLRFASGLSVQPAVSTPRQIKDAIEHHYNLNTSLKNIVDDMGFQMPLEIVYSEPEEINVTDLLNRSAAAPVIKIVNGIITNSIQDRASDIHLEPQKNCLKIRTRVDGLLRDVTVFPKWIQGLITSRIKIIAKMDIAEKRIPQDGKITVLFHERSLDLRVSTLPTQYGENVVIRILNAQSAILDLKQCGFSEEDLKRVESIVTKPQGIVLVAGPTGSGKTSTLYSMLNHIKSESIHIVSLEDPVEYEFPWMSQVSVNEKVGLTFAYTLRSILRQDPDVIMVGEIRDSETALIATQASITGHLVLSSIHTNSAITTITRLKNMGIPPHLIASSLNGIIAQRLVRLICPECKVPYKPSYEEFIKIGIKENKANDMNFYRGTGCRRCGNTGYKGRTGVFETMVFNQKIRNLIASDAPEDVIKKEAESYGMKHMMQDALLKLNDGVTTIEELGRVLTFEY